MDMLLDKHYDEREQDKQEYNETLAVMIEETKQIIKLADNEAEKNILKKHLAELERIAYE